MAELAELKILLQDLKNFDANFKEVVDEVKTVGYLQTKLESLQELYNQFSQAYAVCIRRKEVKQEQTVVDRIIQKYKVGSEIYCMCKGKLRDDISNLAPKIEIPQTNQPLQTVLSCSESIQTPPCDTPVFEGSYEAWPSFRDMFTAIYINNARYKDDINKLFQLRRKVDKEAKAIVESFPLSNASFNLAWEALKTHYENKRMLVNVQLKHLFALPTITNESPTELRHLVSSVNDCLAILTSYDVEVEGWDPILVFFVSKRLPDQTLALWERTIKDPTEIPSWKDLSEFLTSHYKSLEAIADVRTDPRKTKFKYCGSPSTQKRCNNFHAHTAKISCKICSGSHGLRSCTKFLKMSITERIEAVRKNNYCYNCLSTEHFSKNCNCKRNCNACGQRHHTLLHRPGMKTKIQSTNLNGSDNSQNKSYLSPLGNNSNVASSSYSFSDCTSSSNRNASSSNQHHLPNVSLVHSNQSNLASSSYPCSNFTSSSNHNASSSNQSQLPNVHANQNTKTFFNKQNKKILLATVQMKVRLNNTNHVLRALIDPGSEGSFILQSTVNRLRLRTMATTTSVVGMGSIETGSSNRICSLLVKPRFASNNQVELDLIVLKKLTGFLPSQSIDGSDFPIRLLQLSPLADPDFHTPGAIDLVLGADVYPSILCAGVEREALAIAQETIFGWMFSGNCSPNNNKTVSSFYNRIFDATSLDQQLQKFWEVEEVENYKATSEEEAFCEKLYRDTTRRDSDGRYIVNLTFRDEFLSEYSLGVSRNTALSQYARIEKSLSKNNSLKIKYHEVLQDYIDLGHMSPASSSEITENLHSVLSYYLPHHAVVKPESLSTQVRVVFNASRRTSNGASLNDVLHVGPALQQDLSMIIHRWRKFPFVYTADIAKMYRQIWVNPAHAEFQRLLFRDADFVRDFKLRTVTFGINCSPYLAIRTLLQLAEDEGKSFPLAAEIVRHDFYVDDALTGGYEIDEVKEGQSQLIALLKSGGFPLRKFAANSEALLLDIPKEDRVYEEFLSLDDSTTIKALGLTWNIKQDSFTFRFKSFDMSKPLTKRNVFSNIAKLFDPAGWLAPVVVSAKILMQQIWKDKTDWDEIIKTERVLQWERFVEDLPAIHKINIPRWLLYKPSFKIEYHGFCDASEKAMAAVVYMKVVDDSGRIFVNLVSSKTKVAPVKTICVPRLELCGAVLLSKLIKSLTQGMKCTNFNLHLWTDSTIVLTWIKGSPSRWKTFIGNRVTLILNNVGNQNWRHVRSAENPADLSSRGLLASELINNPLWWHGPVWLSKTSEHWPTLVPHSPAGDILEERAIQVYVTRIEDFDILNRFSSFPRALRVLAYCYRFFYRLQPKYRNKFVVSSVPLSQNEINLVKWKLIENTQSHYFPDEYRCLKENRAISSKSALLSFNPYLYFPYEGSSGVMRSCSRLTHASVSDHSKFPILLPYSARYSQLFVKYMHELSLHGGNMLMLYLIRLEYWIPKVQQLIKSIGRHCKACIRHRNQVCKQIMGSLPAERVTFTRPFTHTGIDYAGPFELKVKKGRFVSIKGYVSVFVCFATRAIHLEAVTNLSTDAFIAAFSRFVSRRGVPSVVYSDNGTNFVGATTAINKEIKRAIKNATEEAANLYLVKGLEWKFIPPGAPHMGGLWEAGVRSFKHHFRRVVGSEKLTFEEFYTVLTKIEACLNSRPISPMSEDPHDPLPLTPSHFFGGNPILSMPESDAGCPLNIVKRYEKLKAIQQEFCRRWKSEYLRTLHQRTKWKNPQRNIEPGDMVIVKQDNLPPDLWRVGRVIGVNKGSDGRVRIATLKTAQGNIDRAISKLVRLPMDDPFIQSYFGCLKTQVVG